MLENTEFYRTWTQRVRVEPSTLRRYQRELMIFDRFLTDTTNVTAESFSIDRFYYDEGTERYYPMDKELIEEFVNWLAAQYPKNSTVPQSSFTAVKSFFNTLKANGIIELDPTQGATGPRFIHSQKKMSLTHSELQRLVEVAYNKDPFTQKYVAMILLMAHGGLRNREVRYLTVDKIDTIKQMAVVDEGQKRGPGTIAMSKLTVESLQRCLHDPRGQALRQLSARPYVFIVEPGRMLRTDEPIRIVKDLAKQAGIKKNVTPHMLRHTTATEMYRSGVHPTIIRRHLRQKRDNTTLIYINPTSDEEGRVLQNFSMNAVLGKLISEYGW